MKLQLRNLVTDEIVTVEPDAQGALKIPDGEFEPVTTAKPEEIIAIVVKDLDQKGGDVPSCEASAQTLKAIWGASLTICSKAI